MHYVRGIMEVIPNRSAHTFLPIIQRWVVPGSTIHTGEWAGCSRLSDLGFIHHQVSYVDDFVDPVTGIYTNSIESFRRRLENRMRAIKWVTKRTRPQVTSANICTEPGLT
ncbi:unnamed protein product [Trichobilharzia szidati]|nr:unnamed protein product [Trichobilharzia szidati]